MSIRFYRHQLEDVCREATPGPWVPSGDSKSISNVVALLREGGTFAEANGTFLVAESMRSADAQFIGMARYLLPSLLHFLRESAPSVESVVDEEVRSKLGYTATINIANAVGVACAAAYQRGREDEAKTWARTPGAAADVHATVTIKDARK